VAGGNVLTGGAMSAAGNITGGNVIGTTAVSTGGNVQGGNLKTAGFVSATGDVLCANVSAGNVNTGGAVSATGNIFGNEFTAVGNITGSYFLGNGSQLTGIDAAGIQSGNSNVRVVSSGGNVSIGIGGTSNIAVFSTLGANVTGWIGATGN
jgi:hypothetical protein